MAITRQFYANMSPTNPLTCAAFWIWREPPSESSSQWKKMIPSNSKFVKIIVIVISIGFILWSSGFIYMTSFIGLDGKRYFCLFDDAMISMRYAWNFSHGSGIVWNPGEHIEGYTNFLMVMLMSIATFAVDKSAAVLIVQISGIATLLGIAIVNRKISDRIFPDHKHGDLFGILCFVGALAYYPLVFWSLMGMETGLVTLLVMLSILSALNYCANKSRSDMLLLGMYSGLAFLARNDSIIFSLPIWLYILWDIRKSKNNHKALAALLAAVVTFSLIAIGQLAFQYFYYGELLPNTYALKMTGMPLLFRIQNGLGFVTPFLIEIAFLVALPILDLVLNYRREKLLLFSMTISAISYQIYAGGDPWDYWRMLSPSVPLITMLFVYATIDFVDYLSNTRLFDTAFFNNGVFRKKIAASTLITTLTLTGLISADVRFWPEISFSTKPYQTEGNQIAVNTAIAINQLLTENATVGVFWAGTIPYFTGRNAIDFLGKTDRYIAHLPADLSGSISWSGMQSVPGHNKYDLNYSIKTLLPTYVQNLKWGNQNVRAWAKTRYIEMEYQGVSLILLRESPDILWSKIENLEP
jgi:hypothetical protein